MGLIRRWFRALLDLFARGQSGEAHDVEDAVYAGSRRLLELADAARTSAAQLVAARARLDREIAAAVAPNQAVLRRGLEEQRAELMRQQEAAELQAHELAGEAASVRTFAEGMAAERAAAATKARAADLRRKHEMVARAVGDAVREAEDETLRLVARGRALDELRELEQRPAPDDLRAVRAEGAERPAREL